MARIECASCVWYICNAIECLDIRLGSMGMEGLAPHESHGRSQRPTGPLWCDRMTTRDNLLSGREVPLSGSEPLLEDTSQSKPGGLLTGPERLGVESSANNSAMLRSDNHESFESKVIFASSLKCIPEAATPAKSTGSS